eukprot:Sdes_comp9409_c0_seq1m873
MKKSFEATFLRGGTSKGLFFVSSCLPKCPQKRDEMLLSLMGSPDAKNCTQMNGMGGGNSSSSKVAILEKSEREGIDLNYLFGQVSIKEAKIDWSGSCGNLVSAAGVFAFHKKLIPNLNSPVNLWQENLGYRIRLDHQPKDCEKLVEIDGVSGKSSPIRVEFFQFPSNLQDKKQESPFSPQNLPIHFLSCPNGKKIAATLIFISNPT